jgi:hypothetical protein
VKANYNLDSCSLSSGLSICLPVPIQESFQKDFLIMDKNNGECGGGHSDKRAIGQRRAILRQNYSSPTDEHPRVGPVRDDCVCPIRSCTQAWQTGSTWELAGFAVQMWEQRMFSAHERNRSNHSKQHQPSPGLFRSGDIPLSGQFRIPSNGQDKTLGARDRKLDAPLRARSQVREIIEGSCDIQEERLSCQTRSTRAGIVKSDS